MCGIIFGANKGPEAKEINEWIINQYEDQHNRGSKGFGIVNINPDNSYGIKRATEGCKFMYDLHNTPTNIMMVHHRYPTSTENKMKQTHPIMVDDGSLNFKYLVIHNGVISNDDELKKFHEQELGFVYTTWCKKEKKFNDSESLAIEVARFIEKQTDIVDIQGSAAFIALQINKKTDKIEKVFFGRKGNPLNMAKTRGILRLSSEGMGDAIEENKLYSLILDDNMRLSSRRMPFKPYVAKTYPITEYGKGNYSGYKQSEIWAKKTEVKVEKAEINKDVPPADEDDPEETIEEQVSEYIESMEEYVMSELSDFMSELQDTKKAHEIDIEGYVKKIREHMVVMSEDVQRILQRKGAVYDYTYSTDYNDYEISNRV